MPRIATSGVDDSSYTRQFRKSAARRPDRTEGEGEVIAVIREILYLCCTAIAVLCGIVAATIAVAIAANKIPDPQAWKAVVFFVAIGGASWIAARAARIGDE